MYFSISNNQGSLRLKGQACWALKISGVVPQLVLVDSYILVSLLELKRKW